MYRAAVVTPVLTTLSNQFFNLLSGDAACHHFDNISNICYASQENYTMTFGGIMATLNQAKIITALETIVEEAREDFIFSFLLAYGQPKSTVKRLQMGDKQRNLAQIAGDVAVAQKIYFRPVVDGRRFRNLWRQFAPCLC